MLTSCPQHLPDPGSLGACVLKDLNSLYDIFNLSCRSWRLEILTDWVGPWRTCFESAGQGLAWGLPEKAQLETPGTCPLGT